MTSFIPEEKISEIRNAADIVDVISGAVHLKKGGKNYLGLCPFHTEKTPSFTVSPDKQIFYCFGCGSGGNVFSFVMQHEGLSFPEAVKSLGRRYGIALPERRLNPSQKRRLDEKEQMLAANRMAMAFFEKALNDPSVGAAAKEYLVQRGLTQVTIEEFHIGYAPQGWDNLFRHLMAQRLPSAIAEKSGLIVPRRDRGGFYDRFRDRIIFPIFDLHSQVVGFGGRVMDATLPKYLNSPETALYSKSRTLYGLHIAKNLCRQVESVFVVEGYFDAIALHQHGLANTVATLGTALTTAHVRLLRGCIGEKGRVVLVFDADAAGIKAARRSVEVFDNEFVDAQILILKSGHDPDSFIFEHGLDAFRAAADSALDIISFLLETAVKQNGMSLEGKVRTVDELLKPLGTVSDPVARSLYVQMTAERLGIDESALIEKLRHGADDRAAAKPHRGEKSIPSPRADDLSRQALSADDPHRSSRIERKIIAMMLQVPQICDTVTRCDALAFFADRSLARIGQAITGAYNRSGDTGNAAPPGPNRWLDRVMADLTEEQDRRMVAELAMTAEAWAVAGCEKQIAYFVETVRKRLSRQDIEHRIREAERNNDHMLLMKLLSEKQALAVEREKRKMALFEK